MDELLKFLDSFSDYSADKAILSAPKDKEQECLKCKISLIKLKDSVAYQAETFTKTQAFHRNMDSSEIVTYITAQMEINYNQMEWDSSHSHHSIRISKRGKVLHSSKAVEHVISLPQNHNRTKKYLLPQGEDIPPLVDLGIFTKEGKVVAPMYDKYRQINRFLELVEDVIKQLDSKTLNIIDFGCGKSYLTFILYHYLNNVKKIPSTITGMDLKEQVIDNCNNIAQKYGYHKLKFIKGDIAEYTTYTPVDMVITLHACDTATDYAIYHAINLNSKAILTVPCCQHEINGQLPSDTETIFTRYGLVKERFSALATDAIRGNIMELMGYRTQLLEFVDLTHSPKNILIRGIKSTSNPPDASRLKAEIHEFLEQYPVTPTLYSLLEDKI